MKKLYFFFIVLIISGSIPYQDVFANHISGQDDVFYWREHDDSNANSVWCTFDGTTPTGTEISLQCEGGVFSGTTRTGALYVMKVFDKADIRSGALTNVFTWHYDTTCTEANCDYTFPVVMDGAYDYTSLTEPGGFPNNSGYVRNPTGTSSTCDTNIGAGVVWETITVNGFCLGNSRTDLGNIIGAGELDIAGAGTAVFGPVPTQTKGTRTLTVSVTNALWNESTQSQITVFLVAIAPTGTAVTNEYIRPRDFSITNTPLGTMTWNFPETAGEVTDWNTSLGYNYQQNGTTSDYGYFFSYDPFVPNPPTNAYIVTNTNNRVVYWTAPAFDGYSPIIGYKIERETPVGGGFSTLVANTGNTNTSYTDSAVVQGQVYNYRVSALNTYGSSIPSNESVSGTAPTTVSTAVDYTCPSTTSSFELFIKTISFNSVGICWDTYSNATAITGYQINYTTPFGSPTSVIVNNTGNDDTRSYLVQNLAPATDYSFKVKSWGGGGNRTNIANATTLTGSFVIGNFTLNVGTNPDHVDWKFTRTDANSTQAILDVDYTNTITPSCNLEYRFANTNQTYTNMTSSFVDANTDRVTFIFNNVQNEVIKVRCYSGDSEATYMLTQTSYPLIEQLQNFRNGTYGTSGQFGAIDLITLCAIIFGMLGFNRVNAGVGVIFSILLTAAMASLGLITWTTIGLSGIAVLVGVIAIFGHSREDVTE